MSATIVREKRQTTLPVDVTEAAGIKPGDQVDWSFEDGTIRGRKLEPQTQRRITGKLVKRGGLLVIDTRGIEIDSDAVARAVREERDR